MKSYNDLKMQDSSLLSYTLQNTSGYTKQWNSYFAASLQTTK